MCNLYSNTTAVEAMRRLFNVSSVLANAGNLPEQRAIFPAQDGPVISLDKNGQRQLSMMHWGFILPQRDKAAKVVNNTRDDKARTSRFWVSSFEARRCLIPATSFAEYHPRHRDAKGHKTVVWFKVDGEETAPPFCFAGIWRSWTGQYKGTEQTLTVYSMMTTRPNDVVRPIHPTRMPVMLADADHETWLNGTADEASELLRPFDSGRICIAVEGDKTDGV